jgi:hypothetical protein
MTVDNVFFDQSVDRAEVASEALEVVAIGDEPLDLDPDGPTRGEQAELDTDHTLEDVRIEDLAYGGCEAGNNESSRPGYPR